MTHINCMLSNPWTLIALWLVMFLQAVCCDASQNMLTLPHSPWCPLTLDWIGNGGTFCMVVMRWRGVRRHNAADLVINPAIGFHYFLPGTQLPIILLDDRGKRVNNLPTVVNWMWKDEVSKRQPHIHHPAITSYHYTNTVACKNIRKWEALTASNCYIVSI